MIIVNICPFRLFVIILSQILPCNLHSLVRGYFPNVSSIWIDFISLEILSRRILFIEIFRIRKWWRIRIILISSLDGVLFRLFKILTCLHILISSRFYFYNTSYSRQIWIDWRVEIGRSWRLYPFVRFPSSYSHVSCSFT